MQYSVKSPVKRPRPLGKTTARRICEAAQSIAERSPELSWHEALTIAIKSGKVKDRPIEQDHFYNCWSEAKFGKGGVQRLRDMAVSRGYPASVMELLPNGKDNRTMKDKKKNPSQRDLAPYYVLLRIGRSQRYVAAVENRSRGATLDLGGKSDALTWPTGNAALAAMQKLYKTSPGYTYTVKDSRGRVYAHVDKQGVVVPGKSYRITEKQNPERKSRGWTLWIARSDGAPKHVYSRVPGSPGYHDFFLASNTAVAFPNKQAVFTAIRELRRTRDIPGTRWAYARSPRGTYYYARPPMHRLNPGAADDVWKRSQDREAEGKRRAHEAEADIRAKMIPVDRYQPSWAIRNMIRALEIHSWQNTVQDWQRYYEAKYILRLRRSRSRPAGRKRRR